MTGVLLTEAQEDAIEQAYWEFDARHNGDGKYRGAPQSERDAFKAVMRGIVRAAIAEATGSGLTGYYLAAFHHGYCDGAVLWWRPEAKGYTPDLAQAGVYTAEQAALHDVGKDDAVRVPVAALAQFRVRRTIDHGDHANKAFRSAAALREFLQRAENGDAP